MMMCYYFWIVELASQLTTFESAQHASLAMYDVSYFLRFYDFLWLFKTTILQFDYINNYLQT